jgi:hypothetical protein
MKTTIPFERAIEIVLDSAGRLVVGDIIEVVND